MTYSDKQVAALVHAATRAAPYLTDAAESFAECSLLPGPEEKITADHKMPLEKKIERLQRELWRALEPFRSDQ